MFFIYIYKSSGKNTKSIAGFPEKFNMQAVRLSFFFFSEYFQITQMISNWIQYYRYRMMWFILKLCKRCVTNMTATVLRVHLQINITRQEIKKTNKNHGGKGNNNNNKKRVWISSIIILWGYLIKCCLACRERKMTVLTQLSECIINARFGEKWQFLFFFFFFFSEAM